MTGSVLFYGFAAVAVAGAAGLVTARSLVHAVMSLFACLVAVAALFLFLGEEFLAGMQLFVYGGAVTVLVLFVLMLTRGSDPAVPGRQTTPASVRAVAATASLALLGALAFALSEAVWPVATTPGPTTSRLAESLFTRYVVGFETAGLILTAALIGAIVVARDDDTSRSYSPTPSTAGTAAGSKRTEDGGDQR